MSKPAFGDPSVIHATRYKDLPLDTVITRRDAIDATQCTVGVDKFIHRYLRGQWEVTAAELLRFRDREHEIETILDRVWRRLHCGFCGRIQHRPWCIHNETRQP